MNPENDFLYSSNNITISTNYNSNIYPNINLINKNKNSFFLSSSFPLEIIFNLTKMIKRPLVVRGFGIYNNLNSTNNPRIIEVYFSRKNHNFILLGTYELTLSSGTQVLGIEELIFIDIEEIKFIIKDNFGGQNIIINNIYLYENLPGEEGAMPYNEFMKNKKKNVNNNNNNNTEILKNNNDIIQSESDLSDRKKLYLYSSSNQNNKKINYFNNFPNSNNYNNNNNKIIVTNSSNSMINENFQSNNNNKNFVNIIEETFYDKNNIEIII